MVSRYAFAVVLAAAFAQFATAQDRSTAPVNIKLPPGYTMVESIDEDAQTARIVGQDGFTINYFSPGTGKFSAKYFENNRHNLLWAKGQNLNGHKLSVGNMKDGEMVVIVDDARMFRAKPTSLDQVADILLMTAVYELKSEENISTPQTGIVSAPGNIQLLAGYKYERRRGVDSHVGSISGDNGFAINHDIGKMAGNYARQYFPEHFENLRKQTHLNSDSIEGSVRYLDEKVIWRRRQKVNGDVLMIVYLKDTSLIASFDGSSANFISKVDTFEKLTDFFLTVLSYQPKPRKS